MVEAADEVAKAGVAATLGINGKILFAQLVNFAIIALVLWRWVFKPLSTALESRKKVIDESLKRAADIDERWSKLKIETDAKRREADKEASLVLNGARQLAEKNRDAAATKTKQEVVEILKAGKTEMEEMKVSVWRGFRDQLADAVVGALSKITVEKISKRDQEALLSQALEAIDEYGQRK